MALINSEEKAALHLNIGRTLISEYESKREAEEVDDGVLKNLMDHTEPETGDKENEKDSTTDQSSLPHRNVLVQGLQYLNLGLSALQMPQDEEELFHIAQLNLRGATISTIIGVCSGCSVVQIRNCLL
jgi:hypothetical protein